MHPTPTVGLIVYYVTHSKLPNQDPTFPTQYVKRAAIVTELAVETGDDELKAKVGLYVFGTVEPFSLSVEATGGVEYDASAKPGTWHLMPPGVPEL